METSLVARLQQVKQHQLKYRLWRLQGAINGLGISRASLYYAQRLRHLFFNSQNPYVLLSRDARYPLWCRPESSDPQVFGSIFIEQEYACLNDMQNVRFIIDCGAYVGYSSAYFLTKFPTAQVISIEPDPNNYSMLLKNLAPYKDRVKTLQNALWSHPTGLIIADEEYRDNREWARQVRECKHDESPTITAIDIDSIMSKFNIDRVSILKVDIEGAEAVVFGKNPKEWLSKVDAMVIELHDDSIFGNCSDIVFSAAEEENFEISNSGELAVFRRKTAQGFN